MSGEWYDTGEAGYAKAGELELEAASRIRAHEVFDKLWNSEATPSEKKRTRSDAYAWLAFRLGIPRKECHMARFDEHACRRVITICRRATPDTVKQWASARESE